MVVTDSSPCVAGLDNLVFFLGCRRRGRIRPRRRIVILTRICTSRILSKSLVLAATTATTAAATHALHADQKPAPDEDADDDSGHAHGLQLLAVVQAIPVRERHVTQVVLFGRWEETELARDTALLCHQSNIEVGVLRGTSVLTDGALVHVVLVLVWVVSHETSSRLDGVGVIVTASDAQELHDGVVFEAFRRGCIRSGVIGHLTGREEGAAVGTVAGFQRTLAQRCFFSNDTGTGTDVLSLRHDESERNGWDEIIMMEDEEINQLIKMNM